MECRLSAGSDLLVFCALCSTGFAGCLLAQPPRATDAAGCLSAQLHCACTDSCMQRAVKTLFGRGARWPLAAVLAALPGAIVARATGLVGCLSEGVSCVALSGPLFCGVALSGPLFWLNSVNASGVSNCTFCHLGGGSRAGLRAGLHCQRGIRHQVVGTAEPQRTVGAHTC